MKIEIRKAIAYGLFLIILGVGAIALFSSYAGWSIYLEILSHFQVQHLSISLILFGGLCLTRHKRLILISLFVLAIQFSQVAVWYMPHLGRSPETSTNLKVLVANLHVQNEQYSKVLDLVKKEQPDIALFMEIDQAWIDQLDTLEEILPYKFGKPNPYNIGIAIYSKQELVNPEFNLFNTENNVGITGQLIVNQQPISFVGIHPLPPVKLKFFHLRNRQLDAVAQYVHSLTNPVIVFGDFNITMWSPYFKQMIRKTGLINARQGFGIVPTWPTQSSFKRSPVWRQLLSIPIDHCLVSPTIQVANIYTGPNTGSDHKPLIVNLAIERM
jgi:endonuclease/exonuclease/phosphatase (EEP) superfamily protein YafD